MEARILAVADVVESMSSHRPYRPALGIEAATQEIAGKQGILYDSAVATALMEVIGDNDVEAERTLTRSSMETWEDTSSCSYFIS